MLRKTLTTSLIALGLYAMPLALAGCDDDDPIDDTTDEISDTVDDAADDVDDAM